MVRDLRVMVTTLALAAAIVSAAPSPPAVAWACSDAPTCFAGVVWDMSAPSGTLGAKVTLRSNCMTLSNIQDDFLSHRLRVVDVGSQSGVEIGYMRGTNLFYPDWPTYSIARRYFAYYNPSGGHFSASQFTYDYGTSLTATAYKASTASNDWQLWFGNATSHYVVHDHFWGAADWMSVGTVSTDTESEIYGSANSLYFYNLSGTITPQWAGVSSQSSVRDTGPPMDSGWVDPHWRARMWQNGSC